MELNEILQEKIESIARSVYGARSVEYSEKAEEKIKVSKLHFMNLSI